MAPMRAVSIYSLEGLAGRMLFRLLVGRHGVRKVLGGGLLLQAAIMV